jgi:hypothetical protein
VTYFVRAPHPPSERWTDAGQLPPWLPGVAMSAVRVGRARPSHMATAQGGGACLLDAVNAENDANDAAAPVCSAKGCRTPAVWVLAWNNPKLHTPDRRKTWLACEEHREHLSQFLGMRGFLKDVVALEEWEPSASADDAGPA